MKEVLVLTDFSDSAKHAADNGCALAAQLKANVVLLHAMRSADNSTWNTTKSAATTEASALMLLNKEQKRLERLPGKNSAVTISAVLAGGSLSAGVEECARKQAIILIVMGGRTLPNRRSFAASDVYAVINKANCPVLIVPLSTDMDIKNLVLVADAKQQCVTAVALLSELAAALHFNVHIKYVVEPTTVIDVMEQPDHARFTTSVSNPLDVNALRSTTALNAEKCRQDVNPAKVDVLAITHKKLPRFWRLFNWQQPAIYGRQSDLPMLVLPE